MSRSPNLCGDNCTYRRLYEGSQASLSDMASKQAGALHRVSRLRSGIVTAMKQAFPVQFGDAEAQLGRRMSHTDDEVLLAYLNGFLAMPVPTTAATVTESSAVADLRDELSALGVHLPAGEDLRAWAAAVADYGRAVVASPAGADPVIAPAAESSAAAGDTGDRGQAADTTGAREVKKAPVKRTGMRGLRNPGATAGFTIDTADSVADTDSGTIPWASEDPGFAAPDAGDNSALDVVDDPGYADLPGLDDLYPSDTAIEEPHDGQHEQDVHSPAGPGPVSDPGEDLFGAPTDLTRLFDELDEDPDDLVSALFDDSDSDPVVAAPVIANPTLVVPGPAAPDTGAPPPGQGAPPAENGTGSSGAPSTGTSSTGTGSAGSGTAGSGTGSNAGGGGALRPSLFPATQIPKAKPVKRGGRTPRITALPPDPKGMDVPFTQAGTTSTLTEELSNQLVASVCIPRPVFISDLVAQTGSAEVVAAWQQECFSQGRESPVRFITAKPRHRDRGDLVVPYKEELRKATSEFTRSWWASCLDDANLRGAKLYEVALLLHRFGDQVLTNKIEGKTVILRVNQPRGVVGIVVALDSDFGPGEASRKQVANAVEELFSERLAMIAVLTYVAGSGALDKLAQAVQEEARARAWQPSTPVIASLSWDFAADGGSSALSVL